MSRHTESYDVAVIGLGVMGAMALWQASLSSSSVVGIEQFDLLHSRGSSHGGSRIFRRVLTEGSQYVPLVTRADELWDELERNSGSRLRITTGGITIGTAGGDYLRAALEAALAGDVDVEEMTKPEISHRFPQHALLDDDAAVYEPGAGVIFPETAVQAALRCAVDAGAQIRPSTRAAELVTSDGDIQITVDDAVIRARRVVVATGAWLPRLLPQLDLPIRVQRSVPYQFASPTTATFGVPSFPVFRRKSHHLAGWGIPDVDGHGVKIGVSGETKPWLRRPEDNWFGPDDEDFAVVRQFSTEAFPQLRNSTITAHPCMNARTPDGQFIIGTAAATPGIIVLGGFGGHGFKHATAVGEAAADLAHDRPTAIPIELFSPQRLIGQEWEHPPLPVFDPGRRPAN